MALVAEFNSSVIDTVKWEKKNLSVTFKNGSEYTHVAVPKAVFEEFCATNSAGAFYNTRIKGKFNLR